MKTRDFLKTGLGALAAAVAPISPASKLCTVTPVAAPISPSGFWMFGMRDAIFGVSMLKDGGFILEGYRRKDSGAIRCVWNPHRVGAVTMDDVLAEARDWLDKGSARVCPQ